MRYGVTLNTVGKKVMGPDPECFVCLICQMKVRIAPCPEAEQHEQDGESCWAKKSLEERLISVLDVTNYELRKAKFLVYLCLVYPGCPPGGPVRSHGSHSSHCARFHRMQWSTMQQSSTRQRVWHRKSGAKKKKTLWIVLHCCVILHLSRHIQ